MIKAVLSTASTCVEQQQHDNCCCLPVKLVISFACLTQGHVAVQDNAACCIAALAECTRYIFIPQRLRFAESTSMQTRHTRHAQEGACHLLQGVWARSDICFMMQAQLTQEVKRGDMLSAELSRQQDDTARKGSKQRATSDALGTSRSPAGGCHYSRCEML